MIEKVTIPSLGESITSAFLANWMKQNGDFVEEGDELFELESDKATLTVPAPVAGQLKRLVEEDTEVSIGDAVAEIDTEKVLQSGKAENTKDEAAGTDNGPSKPAVSATANLSPAVRALVDEHKLDPASIKGSGKDGRILKEDVLEVIAAQAPVGKQQESEQWVAKVTSEVTDLSARPVERKKMTRIRQTIARNLVESKQTSAHLTTFNEVDLHRVMEMRKNYGEAFLKKYDIKLGFMSFFVKAACTALKEVPAVNSRIDGEDILYYQYYDIGIAVSTDRGLVVPVLRNADRMSLSEIETSIRDFAVKARNKQLGVDDLTGGTFTITNGGVFGSMLSTPIPTPPQTAVMGMHTIQRRPAAVNDEVVIRPIMYLALTYDHRVIDGREAVSFLVTIKRLLEEPERMILEL